MRAAKHTVDAPPHLWRGQPLLPHEEMMMFHEQQGPVPETLNRLRERLDQAGIEYVIIGAIALGAHGYPRATKDVDLCLQGSDLEQFRNLLVTGEYEPVVGRSRRFRDTQTNVSIDFLISGELAGRKSRNKYIRFPGPEEAVDVNGLPTVTLPRLIELKLVTWRLKDWADVVELIRAKNLDESFAEQINPLVRMAYLECYDQKVEEDKYEIES